MQLPKTQPLVSRTQPSLPQPGMHLSLSPGSAGTGSATGRIKHPMAEPDY